MLSPSNLLLLRFLVGQLIKLSATVAVLMLSSATVAMAQFDSGQISGFVRESSKAIIANAISDLDRTHVLIINAIYELPFLHGSSRLVNRMFGNWEISSIYQYQSGGPFSIRTGDDFAGVGAGSGAQFWNLVGNPSTKRTDFTESASWFNSRVKLANGQTRGWASGQDPVWVVPTAGTFDLQPQWFAQSRRLVSRCRAAQELPHHRETQIAIPR